MQELELATDSLVSFNCLQNMCIDEAGTINDASRDDDAFSLTRDKKIAASASDTWREMSEIV